LAENTIFRQDAYTEGKQLINPAVIGRFLQSWLKDQGKM
jgi:hypothetical protein